MIWLPKKIWGCRQSLKAAFFFVVGMALLFLGFKQIANLSIEVGVLLTTAVFIFWYSWETMRLVELTKYQSDITTQLKQISQRQLEQNEREELVRNRAYLTVQNCHLDYNIDDIAPRKNVVFALTNKGMTPAQRVVTRKYFTSPTPGEKRFGECPIGAIQNYLVPNYVNKYQFSVTGLDLDFALETEGGKKFLVIEVIYSDYRGRQHILISHYQIRSQEPRSVLILKKRHEEDSK